MVVTAGGGGSGGRWVGCLDPAAGKNGEKNPPERRPYIFIIVILGSLHSMSLTFLSLQRTSQSPKPFTAPPQHAAHPL